MAGVCVGRMLPGEPCRSVQQEPCRGHNGSVGNLWTHACMCPVVLHRTGVTPAWSLFDPYCQAEGGGCLLGDGGMWNTTAGMGVCGLSVSVLRAAAAQHMALLTHAVLCYAAVHAALRPSSLIPQPQGAWPQRPHTTGSTVWLPGRYRV